MAITRMVEVDKLVEPANAMRSSTIMDGMDELRESLRTKGQEQPIGVRELPDGTYRIIWGHRRSIAATMEGWSHIEAKVFAPDEGDDDELMVTENLHRTQVSDAEMARVCKRLVANEPEGTISLSRKLNIPQARIERLLNIIDGNPLVWELFEAGGCSIAQATELNKFKSHGYLLQAIERVRVDGLGADTLRRWRIDIQRQMIDTTTHDEEIGVLQTQTADIEPPGVLCMLGNHTVPWAARRTYDVCVDHWNLVLEGLELVGIKLALVEAGLWPQVLRLKRQAEQALEA